MTALPRERTIEDLSAEIEGLESTLAENPARQFINLVPRSGKLKGELEYITVKQYRAITGNRPKPGTSKDGVHIPYNIALDTIADALGYANKAQYTPGAQATDLLRQDIEQALETKHLIESYKQELKRLGVNAMPTQENPQILTTAPNKIDAARDFGSRLQEILNDGNRASDLCQLVASYYMTLGYGNIGRILAATGASR